LTGQLDDTLAPTLESCLGVVLMQCRGLYHCLSRLSYFVRQARDFLCGAFLFCLAACLPASLTAQQTVSIPQVPLAVQNGSAHYLGHFDPQQMLRLAITLQPPHMEEEEQFLSELQDPASPLFHKYLSDAEWNQRFAPSAQDEQAVAAWAQAQGLTITQRFPNRLVVDVEAPVAVIEKALAVSINSYQIGEPTYFSNDRGPSIPAALANVIHSVLGLNNIEVVHPSSNIKDTTQYPVYSPGPAYTLGSHLQGDGDGKKLDAAMALHHKGVNHYSSSGAYDPTDIYSSYAYNYVALQHLGHCCNPLNNPNNSPPESSIAVAISGDFRDSDFSGFLSNYSYLASNVQRHFVDGKPACCDPEATLDVEWSTAMSNSFTSSASTAEIHMYEGATDSLGTLLDVVQHALNDGQARVLNMSWGLAEYLIAAGYLNDFHNVFNQMVGQGWTLVAAAGDGGATTGCTRTAVSYPASDADVTAAAGTSLSTSQSGFGKEVAWTGGPYGCSNNDGGTGGGCSAFIAAPGYQGGTACSSNMRSVPDVALNADGVYEPQNFFWDGHLVPAGGTSIASPEMSGFFAQENAYLLYIQGLVGNTCGPSLSAPCAPMGSANPYIYSEGLTPSAPHYPFYDITSGCNNNDITQKDQLTYFCAGPGYDRTTGWGSANMLQLAWTINYFLAGDKDGPSADFSGSPPANHWYSTDQTVVWTLTDRSRNGHPPNGPAGSSEAWDTDPGDPYSQPTPGAGNSYYGPQTYGATGSANGLAAAGLGCHHAYVRAWDNAGNSALTTYGPLCFDNTSPVVTITLSGNQLSDGNYSGPVLITINATDSGGSGIASLEYTLDSGNHYQPYTGPFYVYVPGYHYLYAQAENGAGTYSNQFSSFTIEQNQQFAVTVSKTGTGSGTVTSTDGGINCGSTCSANYYDEQPVTLTASPAQGSIFTGWQNCDLSFGLTCTLTVTAARSVTAIFNIPVALQLVSVTPCRVVDTRGPSGPFGGPSLQAGVPRSFTIPSGPCSGIPSNAAAYSLNVTAVPRGSLDYLTAWPTGLTQPLISTLNSYDGRVKANAAIVPAGDGEAISVYATNTTDLLLDIDGYFLPSSSSTLAFFPLKPCRVVDTRGPNGPLGGPILANGQTRDFPVLQSACSIPPSGVVAYSFNYTAIPQNGAPLGYLTTWPKGQSQPVVSTLNAPTGTVTANAAIVTAGVGGDVDVYPYGNNTDLVIDINGYFALAASGSQPLSLYNFAPCRVLDTRQTTGAFSDELTVNVVSSPCEVPSAAQGYVLNATVVPTGPLAYLTLWPDGQMQPLASTLNAYDGAVTSNLAIVPNIDGSIDAYAAGLTQLILDISSYFAP
jgi:hypothetical protein